MSIEALKEQARRHEQKEEWHKALEQYKKAIEILQEEDQPDIGLYNRVGDLFVRAGDLDAAVEHYEKAVDLYLEAFLPNNAIAVCKKIIRNVPDRHQAYLRMGQIRAEQGFIPDARTNFLTYAERMQQAGDLDEAFRALIEFCDLAPDETDTRIMVAEQMASHGRVDEAVEQLTVAYRHLVTKGRPEAAEVEAKIRELKPDADLDMETGAPVGGAPEDDYLATFGDVTPDAGVSGTADEPAEVDAGLAGFEIATPADEALEGAVEEAAAEDAMELPTFDLGEETPEGGEEEAMELPTFDLGEETPEEGAEEALELPTFEVGEEEAEGGEEEAMELPTFEVGEEEAEGGEEEDVELPTFGWDDESEVDAGPVAAEAEDEVPSPMDMGAEAAEAPAAPSQDALEAAVEEAAADEEEDLSIADVRARIQESPDDVTLHQRFVELAYAEGDDALLAEAYLGLARTLEAAGEAARAQAAYQQVLEADPGNEEAKEALARGGAAVPVREVAAHEEYVDLGSLILGDEEEKTTRFKVAYEEPSGDEEADFAKMLSQFKQKVSENLDADDVKAHYDLGTAYKEMGLLDEAVEEFQAALRASANHLPTYEMLGQTFMEMGETTAALNTLSRALEVDYDIEDDLVGIYYYLARAHEDLGNTDEALRFYDKVFALDINFADVTERLRRLRQP